MKPVELQVYLMTSHVVRFAESQMQAAEQELTEARMTIKAYSDAQEKLKKTNLPAILDPFGTGKMLAGAILQGYLDRAIDRQRSASARVSVCAKAVADANRAAADAHYQLLKGRVKVVSRGKKSIEVTVKVGKESITRHLKYKNGAYTGYAWDKLTFMEYPFNEAVREPATDLEKAA